jgi:hypothetical protein
LHEEIPTGCVSSLPITSRKTTRTKTIERGEGSILANEELIPWNWGKESKFSSSSASRYRCSRFICIKTRASAPFVVGLVAGPQLAAFLP